MIAVSFEGAIMSKHIERLDIVSQEIAVLLHIQLVLESSLMALLISRSAFFYRATELPENS